VCVCVCVLLVCVYVGGWVGGWVCVPSMVSSLLGTEVEDDPLHAGVCVCVRVRVCVCLRHERSLLYLV